LKFNFQLYNILKKNAFNRIPKAFWFIF
jgi:hypothetical protein